MQKRDKVPATPGQVGEIAGALIGEMSFSKDEAKAIIGKLGAFRRNVRQFYLQYRSGNADFSADLARWESVYGKLFGLQQKPDFSGMRIPEKPENVGPVRLIVVAREILEWTGKHHGPLQAVQETLKEHFVCWQYANNLDEAISVNDRDPRNDSYAIWVKDVREADEEYANKSGDDLKGEGHVGITILERQLLEADYFFEKGEHLDQQNVTLCSGSRSRAGGVPSADWRGSRFCVDRYYSTGRDPGLRSRRVWA